MESFSYSSNVFHFRHGRYFLFFCRYYSESSVCIPKIFVTSMDGAWMFSLSVTIINFIGFAFVAVAYIAVTMKAATSMNQKSRRKDKKNGISWILFSK